MCSGASIATSVSRGSIERVDGTADRKAGPGARQPPPSSESHAHLAATKALSMPVSVLRTRRRLLPGRPDLRRFVERLHLDAPHDAEARDREAGRQERLVPLG